MSEQEPPQPPTEAAIRLHALRRMRDEVREQVRAEAWIAMRRRLRGIIAALALVSCMVGVLMGYYGGGRQRTAGERDVAAAANWGCATSSTNTGETALGAPTPWPIRVYVSGAVVASRVVALPPGSLVTDALDAAGGAAPDADLAQLNLAEPLRDHQHVQVPRLSSRSAPATPLPAAANSTPAATAAPTIDLNTATAEDLDTLPGIGPTRAREIVAYREANGPFETVEDLMLVPGIGPATFEKLVPLVTVSGHQPASD